MKRLVRYLPNRCSGITREGEPCNKPVSTADGYCATHAKQLQSLEIMNILECSQCTFTECPKRHKAVKDLCWYELYDISGEIDSQDKIKHILRETIRAQRLIHRRLMRYIRMNHVGIVDSEGKYNDDIIKRVQSLEDSIVKNLKTYADITGMKVIKSEKTQEQKYKSLNKMFEFDEEIDPVDTEDMETNAEVMLAGGVVLHNKEKMSIKELQRRKAEAAKYTEIDLENIDDEEEEEDEEDE